MNTLTSSALGAGKFTMKKKILLIDDNQLIVKSLSIHLRKAGFEVFESLDSFHALGILDENEIDLVICDIKMPGIDGIELTKRIKRLRKGLPVIVLSGFIDQEIIDEAMQSGATGYLEKPVLKEKLFASINKILGDNP